MPPATPRAISATASLTRRLSTTFAHVALLDLQRGEPRRLLGPCGPRRAAAQQLPRARAGHDDEFELVLDFGVLGHRSAPSRNVSDDLLGFDAAPSAAAPARPARSPAADRRTPRARRSRSRSRIRRTRRPRPAPSASRRCIASSESLLRPRSRCSSTSNDGGSTKTPTVSRQRGGPAARPGRR